MKSIKLKKNNQKDIHKFYNLVKNNSVRLSQPSVAKPMEKNH